MLLEIIRETRNPFLMDYENGKFKIENEILTGFKEHYPVGAHVLIERKTLNTDGSILNGGIYPIYTMLADPTPPIEPADPPVEESPIGKIKILCARNEEWSGSIWLCNPPSDFLALCAEIEENVANTPQGNKISESFGIYSYTAATDKYGNVASWQSIFSARLNKFKRMFWDIEV